MDEGKYSVCCHYDDGTTRYVERDVTVGVAVETFANVTTGIGAWIGSTQRVTVTDQHNVVSLEWKYGRGLTRKVAIVV